MGHTQQPSRNTGLSGPATSPPSSTNVKLAAISKCKLDYSTLGSYVKDLSKSDQECFSSLYKITHSEQIFKALLPDHVTEAQSLRNPIYPQKDIPGLPKQIIDYNITIPIPFAEAVHPYTTVPKGDGLFRLVQDCSGLTKPKSSLPLLIQQVLRHLSKQPSIQQYLSWLSHAAQAGLNYIFERDLRSAFYQLGVSKEIAKWLALLLGDYGTRGLIVIPQGWQHSSALCQSASHLILAIIIFILRPKIILNEA